MTDKNVQERAIRLLVELQKLDDLLAVNDVNDYGESTGFCAERDLISLHLEQTLGQFQARVSYLINRVKDHDALHQGVVTVESLAAKYGINKEGDRDETL